MQKEELNYQRALIAVLGVASLFLVLLGSTNAHASTLGQGVHVHLGAYDPENAPPSKYIKKVTETKTTENLNLRKSASTSSQSLGIMPKGTIVQLTGNKSGTWSQLKWGSKTGWSASQYLSTRAYTKDDSVRYMTRFTSIYATAARSTKIGAVNFRSQVSLLDVSGTSSHIKTGSYHGWVDSKNLTRTRPAKQYRYVQKSGSTYLGIDPKTDTYAGRVHHGEKYEYRRWDGTNRRDEINVNGRWVWTSVTNRDYVAPQYRYAQSNGSVYSAASKTNSKVVGTISKGTKVRWGAWDASNRRDEINLNGKWVWASNTDRKKPADPIPPAIDVKNYDRFTTGLLTLRKNPVSNSTSAGSVKKGWKVTVTHKAEGGWVRISAGSVTGWIKESGNLRRHGPYSVAVYGTLRTGQSAYNVMSGFQQKNTNQRLSSSSLYQLWNKNWTFLTNGPKTVVAEQFQYSDAKGPAMLKKLDIYEGQLKYQGRPMYTRQNVPLNGDTESWTYKTTSFSEKVVKNSGRYISSGDFLKRS
ncbi:SH3 domain-containing protein [Glutamicibacter sp. JC586]|uniref:SH3 domain-containing protein n=1 Tax=Glutamicibacter sp. JC586 TaxID=2590552 RepID=UPI0013577ECD|nr:SH3 domain-containing protein [Glutamicibacter sp. JC586]